MSQTGATARKRNWIWTFILILIVLTVIAAAVRLLRDEPESFADRRMQFKYGSTGGDKNFGIPFPIWQVLPVMFKDKLPAGREAEGWGAFGFITEDSDYMGPGQPRQKRPVGTTLRNYMGIDRIFLNCAVCHSGTVRANADAKPQLVLGMGANTIDLEAFQNFLTTAGKDERFTASKVLEAIDEQGVEIDLINRLALRFIGVDQMRDLIGKIGKRFEFVNDEPEFGPGRFDTFSPAKALLNWPRDRIPEAERIGVVDFPAIWHQDKKRGMWLHWDGNNNKLEERNRSAAFGTGANFPLLDRKSVEQMEEWLLTAKPPSFTEVTGARIDKAKAELGQAIYMRECAACHGASGTEFAGEYVGKTTKIETIATDRHRLDNYSYDLMINQSVFYAGNAEERFQNFRKTDGYANAPLDGVWLRAPYLHNGSVPNLRELLTAPANRKTIFYRGCDVYDTGNMGFASDGAEPFCPHQFKFDTTLPGNGMDGHGYGTTLSDAGKDRLIEYLKTF